MVLTGLRANKTYNYKVQSVDAGGVEALSSQFSFSTLAVDNTAPSVAITVPSVGQTISGTLTVTATAADNVAVAAVKLLVDGTMVGSEDTTSPYQFVLDTTTYANGAHSLVANARDTSGNAANSASVSVTVSNQGPSGPNFYVSPTGTSGGNGSISSPWNLQTALNQPAAVVAGSTIWLRGGTYNGSFTSNLNGTPTGRITVRQYPNERATIDAGTSGTPALTINGAYSTFWGFELTASNPTRIVPASGGRAEGITVYGPNTRLVNLIIHDGGNGVGFWEPATNSEISGCIIYNNGLQRSESGAGAGHGIYVQNRNGQKTIRDTVVLNNFGYGAQGYAQSGWVQNVRFEGSVFYNNGAPPARGAINRNPNLFLGTTNNPVDQIVVTNCFTYQPSLTVGGSMRFGYAGVSNGHIEVSNNYMADGSGGMNVDWWATAVVANNTMCVTAAGNQATAPTMALVHTPTGVASSAYTWNNNTYYDTSRFVPFAYNSPNFQSYAEWRASSGFDAASSYTTTAPTGTNVFVRPNPDEAGRGNVIVYNWARSATVNVDLSSVLQPGQAYEIRNAQNYFAAPVLSGTYNGGTVQLPMNGLTVATPYGYDFTPASVAPEFNVFVVIGH